MKKIFLILTLLVSYLGFSQEIKKPAEGKRLFISQDILLGFLIQLSNILMEIIFLENLIIGKYLIYECEPGEHLFWVKQKIMISKQIWRQEKHI